MSVVHQKTNQFSTDNRSTKPQWDINGTHERHAEKRVSSVTNFSNNSSLNATPQKPSGFLNISPFNAQTKNLNKSPYQVDQSDIVREESVSDSESDPNKRTKEKVKDKANPQ